MERFTRSSFADIRRDIDAALEPVKQKYGLSQLSLARIGFSDIEFKGQLVGKLDPSTSQHVKEISEKHNEMLSRSIGFDRNIIGEKFVNRNVEYTVTEINTKAPKYPILGKSVDGSVFRFTTTVRFLNDDINKNRTAFGFSNF